MTVYDYINGVRVTVTQPDDPAYTALLMNPNVPTTPSNGVYNDKCYICLDPEFAKMGLPLCYPCAVCGGHVPADDTVCESCETDQEEIYQQQREAMCQAEGHEWAVVPEVYAVTKMERRDDKLVISHGDGTKVPAFTSCSRCGIRKDEQA
jgi:hypothetical protein